MTTPHITADQLADLAFAAGYRTRIRPLDRQLMANSIAAAVNLPTLTALVRAPHTVAVVALGVYDLAQISATPAAAVGELAALAALVERSRDFLDCFPPGARV